MEGRRTGRGITKGVCQVSSYALVPAGMATEALAAGTHRTWVRRFASSPSLLEPEAARLAANGSISMCGTREVSQVPVAGFDGFVALPCTSAELWPISRAEAIDHDAQ